MVVWYTAIWVSVFEFYMSWCVLECCYSCCVLVLLDVLCVAMLM